MARRWALLSLHAAELLGALAVAVAAGWPPPLSQPAASNASMATKSARAPVADGAAAGKRNRDILIELSGSPLPGAHHDFDLYESIRSAAINVAVESFIERIAT
jgi:hypothetical protein